jgi:ABC-2 type transport system permease protein
MFLINIHNILPASAQSAALQSWAGLIAHLPPADSWVWLPARAAIGEPLPFLVAVVLCGALFAMTTFGLANRLITNAIAAKGAVAVKARSSRALAPRGGPLSTLRRKEWLLIGRDPWLLSQLAMQLVWWVPTIFVAWKFGAAATYLWALSLILLVGHLAGMLAWLTVSTEEAPDLLAVAPVRRADVVWAKLQAALVPTAVLAAVPLAAAFYIDAWVGFTALLCSTGSALSTSLLHVRHPSAGKRSDLAWRGGSDKMTSVVEMLLIVMWVIFGLLMLLFGWWGMLAFVILLPVADRVIRRRTA